MTEMITLPKQEFQEMKKEISTIKETLEIIMDRELMEGVKRGMNDIKEGRVISHDKIKKKYLVDLRKRFVKRI